MSETEALGGIFAFLMGIMVIVLIVVGVVAIFYYIGLWKVFKKSNQEGWKCLIPIYNTYTLCQITGVSPYWILVVFVLSLLGSVPVIGMIGPIATLYFSVLLNISLAKSFGKDTSYGIGLMFLAPIFMFLLGRSNDVYVGPQPMEDFVFDNLLKKDNQNNSSNTNTNFNQNINNNQYNNYNQTQNTAYQQSTTVQNNVNDTNNFSVSNNQNVKTCPNCNSTILADSQFCTNCGTKIN